MKTFVGITDRDWFDLLSHRPQLDEVNFWQPGGNSQFRALLPGELFLFKLHVFALVFGENLAVSLTR